MKIIEFNSHKEASEACAKVLISQIKSKPNSVLGLATGSTPIVIYQNLVEAYNKGEVDFNEVRSVNLDEYYGLSGNHNQSYRYFMQEHLFNKVNIKPSNTHLPNGTAQDVRKECSDYENLINDIGGIDVQLLGIGLNGHIGFNEPSDYFADKVHVEDLQQSTIEANSRLFDNIDEVPKRAFTMGIGTIMRAKKVILLADKNKIDIIDKVINSEVNPQIPASILKFHPDTTIYFSR